MEQNDDRLPAYEPPAVVTYSEEEILEVLGPAQTSTSGVNTSSGSL